MQERTIKTVKRIEQVAVGLFAAKGVAETTVKDIARGAGLSEGALYRHYASKDDLVWRTFQHHYVALAARLGSAAGREAATRDKLAVMIREICQAHDDDPALFHFLVFVQHGQLNRLEPGTPTPVTVFRDVIDAAITHGELPAQDVDLATALVLGLVLQPMTFVAYGRLTGPQAAYAERIVAAAWATLTSAKPASPPEESRS
jgi:AcrR family transcriptional regulator